MDSTGRIVMPKHLRDKIGLGSTGEAMFAGTGETFQIWNPEAYEAQQAEDDLAAFEGLDPDIDPSELLDMED